MVWVSIDPPYLLEYTTCRYCFLLLRNSIVYYGNKLINLSWQLTFQLAILLEECWQSWQFIFLHVFLTNCLQENGISTKKKTMKEWKRMNCTNFWAMLSQKCAKCVGGIMPLRAARTNSCKLDSSIFVA